MVVLLATNNPGKAREIGALFAGVRLLSLADVGLAFTAGEDGKTFQENAVQKATETAAFLRGEQGLNWEGGAVPFGSPFITLADDSGLEIDALGGLPGVDSALYLGADTSYDVRIAHILKQMKHIPDEKRTARFVCVAACVLPDGRVLTTAAACEGRIAYKPVGDNGFGYDPIFLLPELGMTTAQLPMEKKNEISHRGKAMMKMKCLLEKEAGI